MKKIISPLSIILILILFSCNNSENEETDALALTYNNMQGVWYIKDIINADGTIVPHKNICTHKRDSIIIRVESNLSIFGFINNNCNGAVTNIGCGGFILVNSTRELMNCNSPFNGIISKFTNQKMQIDYKEILDLTYMSDTNKAKGIILTRQ